MINRRKGKKRKWIAILIVIIILLAAVWGAWQLAQKAFPLKYGELIDQYAQQYGVDRSLIAAVIFTESGFRSDAVSSQQAKGLMQITDDTFWWLQSKDDTQEELATELLFQPEINIQYGTLNLQLLLREFEDKRTALAAYNAGRSRVQGWLKDSRYSHDGKVLSAIPYPETANYVEKVERYQRVYQFLYYGTDS